LLRFCRFDEGEIGELLAEVVAGDRICAKQLGQVPNALPEKLGSILVCPSHFIFQADLKIKKNFFFQNLIFFLHFSEFSITFCGCSYPEIMIVS
jgi:hypothetical protein